MSSTITGAPTEYYNQTSQIMNPKNQWWLQKDNYFQHIWPIYKRLKQHQDYRSQANLMYAQMYSDMKLLGLKMGQFNRLPSAGMFANSRVTYNVTRSCVDAATAKIAKIKPRPVYMTENADFNLQLKVKRLNQFVLGMFQQIGTGGADDRTMYGLGRQIFRDSCVFGTGIINFFTQQNEFIKADRNLCEEILVDESEGLYRKPRQIHRHRYVAREVLLDMFPEKADKIRAVPMVSEGNAIYETVSDMVETLESWHLPSGPNAKDGRRVLSIENADLSVEEYDEDFLPFLVYRWSNRILGFYGSGIPESVMGIQLEINKLLRTIQISQHLMSVPQVWLQYQGKTIKNQINNKIAGIKYYTGNPPIQTVPQAMSAEVYQHLERLYQKAFEETGISMLSATSQKPQGLDSAVALREYKDTETERFAIQQQNYEEMFVEGAEMIRKMCRRIVKDGGNPVVNFQDGSGFKTIRFKDIDIPDEKIMISCSPSSLLPKEPAGKLAYVQNLIEAGIYTREEGLQLLDFPDTDKVNNIKLAPRESVIKIVESIIEDKKAIAPEPYLDLEFAQIYSQNYYLRCQMNNCPEDRLDLLRNFMSLVQTEIEKRDKQIQEKATMQQQAAMPQAQAKAPQALPESVPEDTLKLDSLAESL